ncbi:MAG: prepilin peptidase [Acetobacteraceae bacterium]|nr:prepilin peptidase [Acetobacteraceae bacterium]
MLLTVILLIAAPFAGSFLGVLVRRLPAGRPIAWARSQCESCGQNLHALDLVPLVSFAALRGRCRHCGGPIDRFHPAIELAAIGVAAWAALAAGDDGPRLLASCILGWLLLAAAWIDAGYFVLPDAITLPAVVAGLAATWWLDPAAIADHAAAAMFGYGVFRGIALAYRRLRGRDGLGAGDAKLLAASGAWLGLSSLPSVVLAAALLGLMWAALLAWREGAMTRLTPIPFGPSLALATWLIWLYAA